MYGFQKRSDRPQTQKLADGGEVTRLGFKSKAQQEREQATQAGSGPVRGPGTGTSDAIKATVPPGTYIMPADSTRAMGAENLVGLGFHPKKRSLATSPTSTYPGNQAEAAGNIYAKSNADMASAAKGFVANNFPASSAYISDREKEMKGQIDSGNYAGAAGTAIRTGVQGAGIYGAEAVDRAVSPWLNAGARLAAGVFGAGDAQASPVSASTKPTPAAPASALTAAAPTASAVSPDAKPGGGMNPTPPNSGPVPYTVTPVENTNGVQRINQPGKSPLFTNIDPGQAVAEMKGNPIGIVPAGVNPFGRSPGSGGADVSAALQAAAERGDWTAIQNHYQKGGGTWQGQTAEQSARDSLIRELTPGKNGATRQQGELLTSLLNTGQELALRQQDLQGRQGIANEDLGLRREAQGFQTAAQRQVQALQQQYIAETDPAKRNELARQLTVMQGKAPPKPDNELAKARVGLIAELGKQYGASTPYGKDNKPIPFETWAEPMLRAAGMVPTDPRQREGVMLRGKDGKMYRVQNGDPVLVDALSGGAA